MPSKTGRTTEREMSFAVLRYLSRQPFGEASQEQIRAAMPQYLNLTEGDLGDSLTRPGEKLWEQIARNINSHKNNSTSIVNLGYVDPVSGGGLRITDKGREFLSKLDESE